MKLWLAALLVAAAAQNRPVTVVIETDLDGVIEAEIDTVRAPITGANFLKYVDAGRFDGGRFHRTVAPDNQPNNDVQIEVIQAGRAPGTPPRFPSIPLERLGHRLSHPASRIRMARSRWPANGPDAALSDFSI